MSRISGNQQLDERLSTLCDMVQQLKWDIESTNMKIDARADGLVKEVQNTYDLIRNTNNIELVPPKKGVAETIQKGNLKLLECVTDILDKNNLKWFLDYGALLGMRRHGGCIPWDDDIDISMPREDFVGAKNLLEAAFSGTKLKLVHSEALRIYYDDTPLQLDIFPIDFFDKKLNAEEKKRLSEKIHHLHEKYIKFDWTKTRTFERALISKTDEEIHEIKIKNICKDIPLEKAQKGQFAIYHSLESADKYYNNVFEFSWIFPLRRAKFMGKIVFVPNKIDDMLVTYYGKDFYDFPDRITSVHEDIKLRYTAETIRKVKEICDQPSSLLEKANGSPVT